MFCVLIFIVILLGGSWYAPCVPLFGNRYLTRPYLNQKRPRIPYVLRLST